MRLQDAMNEAVDASEDGDVLVFAYSGHGSQQDDEDGEEEDGQDEFLVALDAVPITDDMLQALVSRLPSGVLFTFISGTVLSSSAPPMLRRQCCAPVFQ
jgi:metacaspase-1